MAGKTFAETIRLARNNKNLTQAQVAAEIGVTPAYISELEKDLKTPPPYPTTVTLARILGFKDPEELWKIADAERREYKRQSEERKRTAIQLAMMDLASKKQPDEEPSGINIYMMFQGFILHTGMPVVNIGSSKELIPGEAGYIDTSKTNTVFLPEPVAPLAARITHEPLLAGYEVQIECVEGELQIRNERRKDGDLILKADDGPMVLQDQDLIKIFDYSFRLDMAKEEERGLFPGITWIATLSLPAPEVDIIPGFEPLELTGKENQINGAPEFTFGFQRGGSPEPTRVLPCPWISRIHFSLYFKNGFFLRSGWADIPGKRVYLQDEKSSLHILDEQDEHPLGEHGKIFALPLCYSFEERVKEKFYTPALRAAVFDGTASTPPASRS